MTSLADQRKIRAAFRAGVTDPRIVEMRRLYHEGYTQAEIAKRVGVHQATVCRDLALPQWGRGEPGDVPKSYKKKMASGLGSPNAIKRNDDDASITRT